MDRPDLVVQEQLPSCLNECGEGTVCIAGEELVSGQWTLGPGSLHLLNEPVQRVGAAHANAVARADVPMCARRDDDRMHLALGAVLVVAA